MTQRLLTAVYALYLTEVIGNVPPVAIVVEERCCVNRQAMIDRGATSGQWLA